jgi:tetratricopeptide (TPR) repeat protein
MPLTQVGGLAADAATRAAAGSAFQWEEPAKWAVKGDVVPIAMALGFRRTSSRGHTSSAPTRLVGRGEELARLTEMLADVLAGAGRTVRIVGPAGVGKSALAAAVVDRASAAGFRIASAGFEVTTTRSSYAGLRPLWGSLIGADASPLLAPLFGSGASDAPELSGLDPNERAAALRAQVARLLAAEAARAPLLLVVDDCHWADAASRELLEFLVPRLRDTPVLLLLLARDGAGVDVASGLDGVEHLVLRELSDDAALALAHRLLGTVDDDVAGELANRSGGSPLFLEELVRRSREGVEDPIPDDLLGLVREVVDRLPPNRQLVLKVASVLGRTFRRRDLTGSLAELDETTSDELGLAELSARGLLPADGSAPDVFRFRSDTLQEVAYESLSHASRRKLHQAAGGWLEREYANDLDPQLDLIAYHYGRTENVSKQRVYFALAGRRAAENYANEIAIEHFERLLPIADAAQQHEILLDLGEVLEHIGRWDEAERRYRESLDVVPESPRSLTALGRLVADSASLDDARTLLARAEERARDASDERARMEALDRLAVVCCQQFDRGAAREYALKHLELARTLGDASAEAGALSNLAETEIQAGELERAHARLLEAHRLAVAAGAGRLQWEIESELFLACEGRGDLPGAVAWLEQAAATSKRIGFEPGLVQTAGNEANLRLELGDPIGAANGAARALDLAVDLGDRRGVVVALAILAAALLDQDFANEACPFLERAECLARDVDDAYFLSEILLMRARAELASGNAGAASLLVDAALAAAEGVNPEVADRAAMLRVRLDLTSGTIGVADAADRLEEIATRSERDLDRAIALHELAGLPAAGERARAAAVAALATIHARIPYAEARRRYAQLTGTMLPEPELPARADGADADQLDLAALRARVDLLGAGSLQTTG